MNAMQVIRMLRYRWELAFLVLTMVFIAVFSVLYINTVMPLHKQTNTVEAVQEEVASYRTTTILACGNIKNNVMETFLNGDWIDASVCNAVLRQIIAEIDINSMTNVPEDSTAEANFNESAVILTVSSSDIDAVTLHTDEILQIFSNQKLPAKVVYRGSPIKLVATPTPTQAYINKKAIQLVYNGLISLIVAILCALFAVLTREKCDKTIRSIYHLKNVCDIAVLPCISVKPTESELFALADSFKSCDAVVLTGIKNEAKSFDLACRLAATVVRDCLPAVIINLTNGEKVTRISKIDVIDKWQASPAAFFRSDNFQAEMEQLKLKYKLILFAVPSVTETAHAVSLAELAKVVFLVSFGKDTDESLQGAKKVFQGYKEALLGASIFSYVADEEYIFEECHKSNN